MSGNTSSFTITPSSGYSIASVTGCSGSLDGNTYTTGAITEICSVNASFSQNTYTVSATAGSNGIITPASQSVAHGTTTSFAVTPSTGYTASVSGCGGSLSGNTYTTGEITEACSVNASFSQNTYTLTASSTDTSKGTVSPASQSVTHGSSATLSLIPATGYSIFGISSGCGGTPTATLTTDAITANCNITVSFGSEPPQLASISNQTATQGTAYSLALSSYVTQTDGDSITSYAITGTLPTGVTLNTSTGVLSGTPSESGTFNNLSATASDKDGVSDARSFTLTVSAPPPTATLSKTSDALEGNNLTFTVSLDSPANGITTAQIAYSTPSTLPSGTTAATGASSCTNADYTNGVTSVDIASGQTSASFTVPTCSNAGTLAAKSVTVTLSSVSANAQLHSTASNLSKDAIIYNTTATGKLNDTGIVLYGTPSTAGTQSNSLEATDPNAATPAQQDAAHGRDAQAQASTLAKVGSSSTNGGKSNGFDFTKIDSTGKPLPADAVSWDCVLDNNTGLMWENKTDDNGLRDKDHTYTWYNTDTTNNGGNAGTANGGICSGGTGCDTQKYVTDVNAIGLCGYTNWRMPTVDELQSIADMGRNSPAIDPSYFPTMGNPDGGYYDHWSSTSLSSDASYAWIVSFIRGLDASDNNKSIASAVRLVSGN